MSRHTFARSAPKLGTNGLRLASSSRFGARTPGACDGRRMDRQTELHEDGDNRFARHDVVDDAPTTATWTRHDELGANTPDRRTNGKRGGTREASRAMKARGRGRGESLRCGVAIAGGTRCGHRPGSKAAR